MKPDRRSAPIELWRLVGAYLELLYNMFGDGARIAMARVLDAQTYYTILPWLRGGEQLMRRMLLVEAAALAIAAPGPAATIQLKTADSKPGAALEFHADCPDRWHASFRAFAAPPATQMRPRPPASPGRAPAHGFHRARPIALRLEALLRVYNNPFSYALRLARWLLAKPARTAALTKTDAHTPDLVGREVFTRIGAAAEQARLVFNSS